MIYQAYTIFDLKTQVHTRPFFALTNGEAIRTFTDSVNDPNSLFNRHPDDYELFHIGSYDDSPAEMTATEPVALGSAFDYINKQEPI